MTDLSQQIRERLGAVPMMLVDVSNTKPQWTVEQVEAFRRALDETMAGQYRILPYDEAPTVATPEQMRAALLAALDEHQYDEHGFCRTCIRWENDDEGYPVMHRVGLCPTVRKVAVQLGLREPDPEPCPFEGGGVCGLDPAKHWHYIRAVKGREVVEIVMRGSERERKIREYEERYRRGGML